MNQRDREIIESIVTDHLDSKGTAIRLIASNAYEIGRARGREEVREVYRELINRNPLCSEKN